MPSALLDGKMERHIDEQTRQYNNAECWHILKYTLNFFLEINSRNMHNKPGTSNEIQDHYADRWVSEWVSEWVSK